MQGLLIVLDATSIVWSRAYLLLVLLYIRPKSGDCDYSTVPAEREAEWFRSGVADPHLHQIVNSMLGSERFGIC